MSQSAQKKIENAVAIIEKFGGIRPMSSKINVAVTTIQGWKKRDTIPANRKALLLRCAEEHKIDLSEFFDDAPVVENVAVESVEPDSSSSDIPENQVLNNNDDSQDVFASDTADDEAGESGSDGVDEDDQADAEADDTVPETQSEDESADDAQENDDDNATLESRPAVSEGLVAGKPANDFTEIVVETERRAVTKSAMVAVAVVVVAFGAVVMMLWPDYEEFDKRGDRLSALEGEVSEIQERQLSFKGLVPENWSQQLEDLKQQMAGAKDVVDNGVRVVKDFSTDLVGEEGIEKRVVQLEGYVSEITSGNGISALIGRYDSMRETMNGQAILDRSAQALQGVFGGPNGKAKSDQEVNEALDRARSEDSALGQTLSNVPKDELKAAAMLFALTQVRSALNRKDKDFDGDLQLLMNMVGDEDVELRSSLTKLAPHSKSGLLSAYGLKEEFQTVTGEVVAASLSGEDVSFTEKMSAKMNEILKVEKSGEMVSGSDTQKTVDQAQKLIEKNRLSDAMTLLKKRLNDKELKPLRPWLKRAEAVLASQSVQQAIERAIQLNTGKGYLGGEQLLKDGREPY